MALGHGDVSSAPFTQPTASAEVHTSPVANVIATNVPLPKPTTEKSPSMLKERGVQTMESVDVNIVPCWPTTTNEPFPYVISCRRFVPPPRRSIQVTPLDEVKIDSLSPAATKRPFA